MLVCGSPSRGRADLTRTPHSAYRNPYVVDALSPPRAIGSESGRTPVASKIAAPAAGAIAMIGVSPAPIDG